MPPVDQPVALVTGANRGLGAAIAADLAARGYAVAVTGRDGDACADVAAQIGGGAIPAVCDVSDPESVAEAMSVVLTAFERIDALVNNAGIVTPIGGVGAVSPEDWQTAISANLVGAYRMIHAVLPTFEAQGRGRIVNISSGAALRPQEGWSAYCASKAGLAMLTRSVDMEWRPRGVLCFSIAPGVVDTGMQQQIRDSGINPVSRIPRAALAPAEEPAKAIGWLVAEGTEDLAGRELDVRDPALRATANLPPLPEKKG